MTIRAVIIGMLLALLLAVFGYFMKFVMKIPEIAGDLLPVGVYGLLILMLVTVNPLFHLIRRWRFKSSEWCVIVSLLLMGCIVIGPVVMWNFSNSLVMNFQEEATNEGWQKNRLMEYAPRIMLVDVMMHRGENLTEEQKAANDTNADRREKVVTGFKSGLRQPGSDESIKFSDIPWYAWKNTLWFWLSLLGMSFLVSICVVLVVHRQWSHRERLRYPVADFGAQLVHGSDQRFFPDIFYNRRFWFGFGGAFIVLLINGYYTWNENFINIPLTIDIPQLRQQFPDIIDRLPWDMQRAFIAPTFYFAIVGFAYFISTEVSFSLGISNLVYGSLFLMVIKWTGIDLSGGYLAGGVQNSMRFGSYFGMALMIFYIGRRFYWDVLLRAFMFHSSGQAGSTAVWACRGVIVGSLAMIVLIVTCTGLNWMLATLAVMLTGIMFLVMTRVSVETGLFFIQPTWHAVGILLGLFGIAALGPNMLIILGLLSLLTTVDPRVCLMPLVANALRFGEVEKIKPAKLGGWMALTVIITLVVGVIAGLYVQYDYGGADYGWANDVAKEPFTMLQHQLTSFEGASPDKWEPFRPFQMQLNGKFVWPVLLGLGLVIVCSWLRLRFRWWPIHPVLFVVWGTMPMGRMGASLLLGWFIKVIITRLGGSKAYQENKPVFLGLVTGEFVAAIFWVIVSASYFVIYDTAATKVVNIHP